MQVEVLISTMNLQNKQEWQELIRNMHLATPSLVINQTQAIEMNIKEEQGMHRILSYINERGLSKSRNLAIENATGEICLLADDDVSYIEGYEKVIEEAFEKSNADIIVFYVENQNKMRQNKKIRNGKIHFFQLFKARSYEIAFRKEKIKESCNIFDVNYGAGSEIDRGEETIFLADCYRSGLKIISCNKKIGYVLDKKSTWFNGYNMEFMYKEGATFKRYSKKYYKLIILQYAIRKHKLYKKNLSFYRAIKKMYEGARSIEDRKA